MKALKGEYRLTARLASAWQPVSLARVSGDSLTVIYFISSNPAHFRAPDVFVDLQLDPDRKPSASTHSARSFGGNCSWEGENRIVLGTPKLLSHNARGSIRNLCATQSRT